jgi:ABC-type siderophore export system fused ATPase/permease subunit
LTIQRNLLDRQSGLWQPQKTDLYFDKSPISSDYLAPAIILFSASFLQQFWALEQKL